jgi:hypothetical protein
MRAKGDGMKRTTHRSTRPRIVRAGFPLVLLAVLGVTLQAGGDATEDLPVRVSEIPKILFVVERNASMETEWYGVTGMPSRWEVVQEAIIAAVNSAPTEMEFAVVGTSSPSNHWKRVSSFDHPNHHLANEMEDEEASLSYSYIASSYAYTVYNYLSLGDSEAEEWDRAPFRETCSEIDVIVIGDQLGGTEDNDTYSWPPTADNTFTGDVFLTVNPWDEVDQTFLDDVAFYAANYDLNATHDGAQTVRTHTILVDADSVADTDAEDLFESAATVGAGIYTRAAHPDDVALGISLAITDKIRSMTGISSSFTSATGHRLFRGWTEIWGFTDDVRGVPLHRGHFEAFQVVNDPTDENYGDVGTTPLWDAGEILASRVALPGETNSNHFLTIDHDEARTLFTNSAQGGVYSPTDLVKFDSDNVTTLSDLMLEDYGHDYVSDLDWLCDLSAGPFPPNDFNRDCEVNDDDGQEVIDFLRGVDTQRYGAGEDETPVGGGVEVGTEFPERGPWKMGGMFLSSPAFADSQPPVVTDDPSFYAFLSEIYDLYPVAYLVDNNGFLHAFKIPFLTTDDEDDEDGFEEGSVDTSGGWELWGYIPRHLLDAESDYVMDHHRAINLMFDGELYLNDGAINLTYVWMDGVSNGLGACPSVITDGEKDPDGCEYHRILVVSMGLGSRYHYALDVSNPTSPKFLWEWVGDTSGWRKGMSAGTPVFGEVLDTATNDYVPVVFWTSGPPDMDGMPSSSHRAGARWYMTDLVDPGSGRFSSSGYRVNPSLSTYIVGSATDPRYSVGDAAAGLFSTPAAVDYDEDGVIDALYMGSRHGYLFKVLIDNGDLDRGTMESISSPANTCTFAEPYTSPDMGDAQAENHAVFFRPSVSRDNLGRVRVSWGTGWPGNLFDPYDNGYVWFVSDGTAAGDEWDCAAGHESDCGPSYDPYILGAGEKLAGPVLTYGGVVYFVTYITDNESGAACGVGHARIYALSLDDCTGAFAGAGDYDVPDGVAVNGNEYASVEGIPSRFSYSNDGIYLTVTTADGSIDSIGPIRPQGVGVGGDHVTYANWRNVY